MTPMNLTLLWAIGGFIQAILIVRFVIEEREAPAFLSLALTLFAPIVSVLTIGVCVLGITDWLSTCKFPKQVKKGELQTNTAVVNQLGIKN
jgi:hypothetical protein